MLRAGKARRTRFAFGNPRVGGQTGEVTITLRDAVQKFIEDAGRVPALSSIGCRSESLRGTYGFASSGVRMP